MSSLLIHHANILSFHEGFVQGNADALLVEENKVKAVGKSEDLLTHIRSATTVVDAGGKTLMPGFNDTHIHLWKAGNLKTYMLDLRGVSSLEEMLHQLEQYARQYPDAAWIIARGFNEALWKESRLPVASDIDSVVKDRPVYIIRTCAHIAVANTLAMQLSGITKATQPPEGGLIYTDASGNPNGIFAETALGLITAHLPAYTKEQLKAMVRAITEELFSYGITAATDPAVDSLLLEAYHEMNHDNELGFRLNALPIVLPDGGEAAYPIPSLYASDYFNVNTVKFFSDGGLSGKTAALKRAYKDSTEQGILRLKEKQYLQLCRAAMDKGFGVATHAIGDAAIEFVLMIYQQLTNSYPSLIKRIEHLGLPEAKHLKLMQQLGISTSMQSIFINELGPNFAKYVDEKYLSHCYPVKSVLQRGILTALSSDAPVVGNFNPLKGVEAAVTRKTRNGDIIAAAESISTAQALQCYTSNAARISGTNAYGSIEEGKLADFILLNKDPLLTMPEELASVQVEETYINGQPVWKRQTGKLL